jgi:hypothetical protein
VPSMTWLFVIFQREHNQQAANRSLV